MLNRTNRLKKNSVTTRILKLLASAILMGELMNTTSEATMIMNTSSPMIKKNRMIQSTRHE